MRIRSELGQRGRRRFGDQPPPLTTPVPLPFEPPLDPEPDPLEPPPLEPLPDPVEPLPEPEPPLLLPPDPCDGLGAGVWVCVTVPVCDLVPGPESYDVGVGVGAGAGLGLTGASTLGAGLLTVAV